MAVIELRGVSFRREGKWILKDIDWRVDPGQHWAMLGANGSGKTTLLKILTGYEWATAGTVSVLGKTFGACDLPELRKTIGWVSTALSARIPGRDSALEVVLSGMEATLGVYREFTPGQIEQGRGALAQVSVHRLAAQSFGTLSQGEQQRVLIARALVHTPALLVLDEPCAGLDPAAREQFLEDLAAFAGARHAPAIVLVTHHIEEVGPWLTHGIALKDGRVLGCDEIANIVRDDVLSEMLAKPGKVVKENGRYRLELDPVKT